MIKGICFDLDGTLLDSFTCHFEAYRKTFARFGIEISRELFLRAYSPDWYRTYESFGLAREKWNEADIIWRNEAKELPTKLLPGVKATLGKLRRRFKLGIVSSGSQDRVFTDLTRTRIKFLFEVIVTSENVRFAKPHPEALQEAMDRLRIRPNETVYVGDAVADLEMARAANVPFIGVASEFANLTTKDTSRIVHELSEVNNFL